MRQYVNAPGGGPAQQFPGAPARAPRGLAAALLLAVAGLFILPDEARAQTAYVSNLDARSTNTGFQVSSAAWQGVQFSTGSQAGGYPLHGIGLTPGSNKTSLSGLVVKIYTESGGLPDTLLYTLIKPTSLTGGTEAVFSAPANTNLDADTNYFVAAEATGSFSKLLRKAVDGSEDSDASAGWSIADDRVYRDGAGGAWSASSDPLAISVYAPPVANATGAPAITGTPQVGQTLTAGQGTIADADGLPDTFPDDYTFQWIRVDGVTENDISSATSSTYTPVAADVGKTLKVKVQFTDDAGNSESLTSDAYPSTGSVVAAASACPANATWCGTMTVGTFDSGSGTALRSQHIGYNPGVRPPRGSLSPATFSHGGTANTVALLDWRKTTNTFDNTVTANVVRLKVAGGGDLPDGTTFTVDGRSAAFTVGTDSENSTPGEEEWDLLTLGSPPDWVDGQQVTVSLTIPNTAATGAPDITGTPQVGQTLTAGIGTIDDSDGRTNSTFPDDYTFQWVRVDGVTENDISSATSSTYTPVAADVGKTLKVKVGFSDDGGNDESLTSDATASVVAAQSDCATRVGADWCTTMTVGYGDFGSTLAYGFDNNSAYGTLDQATFAHGGVNYTVTLLEQLITSGNANSLRLQVFGGLPVGTRLEVDGRSGAFTVDSRSPGDGGLNDWNLSLADPPLWLVGQQVTVSLNLPPALVSASVNGAALVLTYSEDLDTGSEPATNAYTVTVDGSAATVSNVAVSGAAVTLTLANAVSIGQTVTVSYTAPGTNPVQDESGLDAPSFSNGAVTNNTGNSPATGAPVITGIAQEGETLTAHTNGISDSNGLTNAGFSYQWLRFKAQTRVETTIPGATSSTYTLVQRDVGVGIKVRASFTDDDGFAETLTSDDHPLSAPYTDNHHPAPTVMRAQTSCPAGDDWCATLTVGVNPPPSVPSSIRDMGMQGYTYDEAQNLAQGPTLGAMGDYRPTLGGDTYTINTLLVSLETWPDWNFGIYTDPVLPLGTRLTLNGLTFTMTRGTEDGSDGYKWEPPPYRHGQLAWVENQKVTVSLKAPENHAATGRPEIIGVFEVRRSLRAVTEGIVDANGLDNVEWGYQWVRIDGHGNEYGIPGATGEFYRPVGEDEGLRLKVRVSFSDDHGFAEVRESERTAVIRPLLPGAVTLLDTTLRVAGSSAIKGCESYGRKICADRLGEDTFISAHPDGDALTLRISTLRLHNVPPAHGGETNLALYFDRKFRKLRNYERENLVLVLDDRTFPFSSASDRTPSTHAEFWYDIRPMDWSEGQTVRVQIKDTYENRRPTGRPSISGGSRVGDTVSAGVGTLADPDGLPDTDTFSWQWVRVNDGGETDIAGATSDTYTLTPEDRGKTVKVKASYTDNHGNAEGPHISSAFPRSRGLVQAAPSGVELDTTFTVRQVAQSWSRIPVRVGCSDDYGNDNSRCLWNMGRTRFEYRGREHRITGLVLHARDGTLSLRIVWPGDNRPGVTSFPANNGMWLEVDGNRQFDAAESTSAFHSSWTQSRYWESTGLDWSVDERVRVRICDGTCSRTVTADDAVAIEGEDASLDFAVSMYPPSSAAVTVDYSTSDVTATAGEDYRQTSGALTFAPGETQKTISVPIIDDAIEDSGEKVRLLLGNPSDGVLGGGGEAIGTIRNEEAAPLTASFSELPEAHDGSEEFTVQLDFSEAPRTDIGHIEGSLQVTGGTLVRARRVTKGDDAKWTVTLRPSGDDAVAVSLPLPETTDCEDDAAICTSDGRMLSEAASATVPGPAAAADGAQPLTASFSALPEVHDGETAFTLRVAFSEALPQGSKPQLRRALSVTGGSKSTILRVDDRFDLWEVTVTPSGTGEVTVTLASAGSCGDDAALCTSDGRLLSEAVTAAVPGPATEAEAPAPLTASFENVPSEHDGETAFTLRVAFSEALPRGSKPQLRRAMSVAGGSKSTILRVDGRLDLWEVTVTPSGTGEVTVTLASAGSCGDAAALCTSDGRALTGGPVTATVQGPPGLAVADAEVDEAAEDAALAFVVTLSRAASGEVTVAYETSDGTAVAPADYTSTSGTLTFAVGDTTKTVSVPVHADALDEGDETLTLTLSDPTGAYLAEATATGTIHNTGPIPQAWLARFGRTVADQVIDAVDGRLRAARTPGVEATVAGRALSFDAAAVDAGILAAREEEARTRAFTAWLRGEDGGAERAALSGARAVTARELLTGTSFALTRPSAESGTVSAWGRGTVARFDGREGELTLDGEVGNLMLGADFTHGRATAGLMVSHARGSGGYRGASAGRIEANLTGLYPYGRYAVNDRLSGWGIAGYGKGTLRVEPEAQAALETDMDLVMGSVGVRGILVKAPPEGGAELAIKSDAMVVRTTSEAVSGSGGNLAAAEAEVTRLRLGLEGWRAFRFAGGASLTPSVELGVRHDGGDAESGFGADIGAALAWQDPAMGLSADVSARGLLTHEDGSFREWGFAGALAWDPAPASARGPSLSVRQTVGAPAAGGVAALLGPQTATALEAAHAGTELERRTLEAKAGYGFALFDGRYTGTPILGLSLTDAGREAVLAWRLAEEKSAGLAFGLDVEGARQENAGGTAGHRLGLGFGWRLEGAGADGLEVRFEGTRLQPANDAAEHRAGLTFTARW